MRSLNPSPLESDPHIQIPLENQLTPLTAIYEITPLWAREKHIRWFILLTMSKFNIRTHDSYYSLLLTENGASWFPVHDYSNTEMNQRKIDTSQTPFYTETSSFKNMGKGPAMHMVAPICYESSTIKKGSSNNPPIWR